MNKMKRIVLFLTMFFFVLAFARPSYATSYDLIAPSGELTRDQEVQFTVNINTENLSLTDSTVGMTYDTRYLQYVSTVPGDTMSSVTVSDLGSGKLLLSGASSSGYSGSGVFAYISFKIIASAPGSAELCVLWAPSPTTVPLTSGPIPTSLPKTGEVNKTNIAGLMGAIFFAGFCGLFFASKHMTYEKVHHRKNKDVSKHRHV